MSGKSDLELFNETGEFSLADNLAYDLNQSIDKLCNEYITIYDEYKHIEALMENAKDRLAEKKSELVTVLDGLGMSSRKLGDINLILRTDSRPEVTDFDGLTDYIKNVLDEPLSEYTKLSFDPKKLRELIKDANEQSIREHKPLVECMPAGLESHITKTIVVRGYKAETSKTTNKEEIL